MLLKSEKSKRRVKAPGDSGEVKAAAAFTSVQYSVSKKSYERLDARAFYSASYGFLFILH